MINRLLIYFHNLPPGVKAAITSFFVIVAFVIGAVLEDGVQKAASDQPGDQSKGVTWILMSLALAGLWGWVRYFYHQTIESHTNNLQAQERAIADARERVNKLSIQHLASCDAIVEKKEFTANELRSVLICEIDRISGLVTAAWEVVNSHHNRIAAATERINFELTLITPSFRDSELTIAAWCNRDNRRPKSLLLRDENNIKIYGRTEAAKMISSRIMDTIVIQDTSDPNANYESLYEGQKVRIRSAVLHPILSPKSEHLGVLVLHCERAGFFLKDDRRYWHELFTVFAPSIALEIERIRAFNKAASAWPSEPISEYRPY